MTVFVIFLIWTAAVLAVDMAVIRPWKNAAARALLPWILCIIAAAWVLGTGIVSYRGLMGDGAWTGASIALGFVPAKAMVLSLLAYAAGRSFLTARLSTGPTARRWALPAGLAALTLYAVGSDIRAIQAAALERHAADPALSPEDVAVLVGRIRGGAAAEGEIGSFLRNPLCPPELLAEYAVSPESARRQAVAANDTISAALAEKLAGDSDEVVRYYLAFNRKLPPEILARLAADSSEMVRGTVAWTAGLPDEDFNRLVNDPSPEVRATAARQSRISSSALEKLRNDPDRRVRDAANR